MRASGAGNPTRPRAPNPQEAELTPNPAPAPPTQPWPGSSVPGPAQPPPSTGSALPLYRGPHAVRLGPAPGQPSGPAEPARSPVPRIRAARPGLTRCPPLLGRQSALHPAPTLGQAQACPADGRGAACVSLTCHVAQCVWGGGLRGPRRGGAGRDRVRAAAAAHSCSRWRFWGFKMAPIAGRPDPVTSSVCLPPGGGAGSARRRRKRAEPGPSSDDAGGYLGEEALTGAWWDLEDIG